MEVGIVQIMQSFGYENITDAEVYDEEIKLAVHADELGFDHVWTVEHHFEDYSFCPDNFVYLAHIAAASYRGICNPYASRKKPRYSICCPVVARFWAWAVVCRGANSTNLGSRWMNRVIVLMNPRR
jgi:hypothetical protein